MNKKISNLSINLLLAIAETITQNKAEFYILSRRNHDES